MLLVIVASCFQALAAKPYEIEPRIQTQERWCWAAVAQMVYEFKVFIPELAPGEDMQCSIVKQAQPACAGGCSACLALTPVSIQDYARILGTYQANDLVLESLERPLTQAELQAEILAKRPVVAGITVGLAAAQRPTHLVLVIDYMQNPNGGAILTVNDPAGPTPRWSEIYTDWASVRWTQPGQYLVRYDDFVGKLHWTESIWRIGIEPSPAVVAVDDATR